MKRCARCKQWKDEEEFNWRYQGKGIRQSICRQCSQGQRREHYERHTEEVKEKSRATRNKARHEAEVFVYEFLSNSRCADCGEYDFSVLTFDHVRGKKKLEISTMMAQGYSIDAIKGIGQM